MRISKLSKEERVVRKKLYDKGWNGRNKTLLRDRAREYRKGRIYTPEQRLRAIDRKRRSQYGISNEDYDRMMAEQNGICKICNKPHKKLVIDHCHATGKVRGLLCSGCNRSMHLLDNPELFARALAYKEGK